MCNKALVNVRSVSSRGVKVAAVPCNKCAECRAVNRDSWAFRVRVEFAPLVKKGWRIGFITLTYNDESLPHIPKEFFKDKAHFRPIMCFSRDHIKRYLKDIHNSLYTRYGLKDEDKLRFLICSEFGEHTQRSHYHALFCYPSVVPDEVMFELAGGCWPHGFHFPKKINGGPDGHGYEHKPFVVDCLSAACSYTAKYVCKDLKYAEYCELKDFFKHAKIKDEKGHENVVPLSRYLNFHTQSKSLGFSFIKDLDEKTALDYYLYGVPFDGEDRLRTLPIYLKNKLFFNNYYVYDITGKRLCRRIASEFAEKYKNEIFAAKVLKIKEVSDVWLNKTWNLDKVKYGSMVTEFHALRDAVCDFADYSELPAYYLAYGNLNSQYCQYSKNLSDFWFSRYQCVTDGIEVCDVKSDAPHLPSWFVDKLSRFFWIGQFLDNEERVMSDALKFKRSREIDYYRDLFKSIE